VLFNLWSQHHLLPSQYFNLSRGEQQFLMCCAEVEIEREKKGNKGGR
jgi:hypothetical protein